MTHLKRVIVTPAVYPRVNYFEIYNFFNEKQVKFIILRDFGIKITTLRYLYYKKWNFLKFFEKKPKTFPALHGYVVLEHNFKKVFEKWALSAFFDIYNIRRFNEYILVSRPNLT